MFLKELSIHNEEQLIRSITFHKGINLIIDETKTDDKRKSGNNVGKTTVLRLIDFCLGGKGNTIYKDPEFKNKGENSQIKSFLKDNNIIVSLIMKKNLDIETFNEIVIRRNFLSRNDKIQEINGKYFNLKDFSKELKKIVFKSEDLKPTFRQIIAKNIRHEKLSLTNTIKVLHTTTKQEEYEALYFFWLGINLEGAEKKQELLSLIKVEENLQNRLEQETTLSKIEQSLIIINRDIRALEKRKNNFNLNENYKEDLNKLNFIKSEISVISTRIGQLELRKALIIESKKELEKEIANIDIEQIKLLYKEAHILIPDIQKTFEQTLNFHNEMLEEKKSFILQELPNIENEMLSLQKKVSNLIIEEEKITGFLQKYGVFEELEKIISKLNRLYEEKGNIEEQKRLFGDSIDNKNKYQKELARINQDILSKKSLLEERIEVFNRYFSEISQKLYDEKFVLSSAQNKKGYELNISTISGNPGTGKKKGQIAAFDLAYVKFAEEVGIDCLHFILHDQIENVHDNQITVLLEQIVSKINCQYILPVLRDKLPDNINIEQYKILSLSQNNKLFKI